MPWDNIIDYWPILLLVLFEYLRRRLLPIGGDSLHSADDLGERIDTIYLS